MSVIVREVTTPTEPPGTHHGNRHLQLAALDFRGKKLGRVDEFEYSFDNIAGLMEQFIDQIELKHYRLMPTTSNHSQPDNNVCRHDRHPGGRVGKV